MKNLKVLLATGVLLCATCALVNPAFSEDNIFGNIEKSSQKASTEKTTTVKVEETVPIRGTTQMNEKETLTNQSLQSSISSLESAQTDLRNKLETAQANYNTVDQEYQRIKQERAALRKIVKKTNSRIKSIEKSKKSLQKAMDVSDM